MLIANYDGLDLQSTCGRLNNAKSSYVWSRHNLADSSAGCIGKGRMGSGTGTEKKKSVVIVKAGASKDASYDDGVAVFTMPTSGLMAEATVGGQKFQYTPK